jgi:hypothetical protein
LASFSRNLKKALFAPFTTIFPFKTFPKEFFTNRRSQMINFQSCGEAKDAMLRNETGREKSCHVNVKELCGKLPKIKKLSERILNSI